LSPNEQQEHFNRVCEYETRRKANEYYTNYVRDVMSGKKMEFDKDTFFKLVEILGPIYLKSEMDREQEAKYVFWSIREREVKLRNRMHDIQPILKNLLFTVDGETWTVERFLKYRRSHPLVFRQKKMESTEFANNFKQAIVDMVTDYYLTKKAYKYDYDKINIVERNYNMWKDNLAAIYYREKYLYENGIDSMFISDQIKTIDKYLNPYIDILQKKYSDVWE